MREGKNWTQAELDQLAEEWGMYSVPTIAKRMGRSVNAIKIKASKMGLGGHIQSSALISLNVLFKTLGLSAGGYAYSLQNLQAAGLKIHMHRVQSCSFRMVDIAEFWEFAENHRQLFDFSRMEENVLGEEPEWVKVKRREDFERCRAIKTHKEPWTQAEEKELLRLLRTYRYTWPEIAERLHRSEGSIQRRLHDLGIKERPLKADTTATWTEEQLQTIGRMIKAGSNYEAMSKALGKSTKAIRGKVFVVYLTENLDKVRKLIGNGNFGDNRPERTLSQRLHMTREEKQQTKDALSKLAGLLTYRIRKEFDDQDNWQRHLCQHWDEVRGCTAGGVNCDDCADFQRVRPQYCGVCGATFYERKENRICERCRTARKKRAARKYMREKGKRTKGEQDKAKS